MSPKVGKSRFQPVERGASLLEMTLIVPFLLGLIVMSIDLGLMLNNYITLSRVAYEGSRYAARVPGYHDRLDGGTTVDLHGDQDLIDRLDALLESYSFEPIGDGVSLTAEFSSTDNQVRLRLDTSLAFKFPVSKFFAGYGERLSMKVNVAGPYLYPDV